MTFTIELDLENSAFRDDDTDEISADAVSAALSAIARSVADDSLFWVRAAASGAAIGRDAWQVYIVDLNGNRCGFYRVAPAENIAV